MKQQGLLKNNLIIIFCLISFFNCASSQIKQNTININKIVDSYINFYSKNKTGFNSKERYLMLSISENLENKKTNIHILDNCYDCPGVINNKMLVVSYNDYKIVIATNLTNQEEFIFKNFKNISKQNLFSVPPYQENITYNNPRTWRFEYDAVGKLIFFCNSVLPELEETKKALHIDNSVIDCDPRK
ncbi:hypothetical protein [Chryseobacterium rhizosphaerae]|uniref:hypothetical protein n=2 Tax=Chryseobacterium TaxID=59732 RepID=UPI003D0D8C65